MSKYNKDYANPLTKEAKLSEEPIFRLKITEHEKYKNKKKWFKDYADYIVPEYNTTIDEYDKMSIDEVRDLVQENTIRGIYKDALFAVLYRKEVQDILKGSKIDKDEK